MGAGRARRRRGVAAPEGRLSVTAALRRSPAGRPATLGEPAGAAVPVHQGTAGARAAVPPQGGRLRRCLHAAGRGRLLDGLVVTGVLVWGLVESTVGDAPGRAGRWGYVFDVLLALPLLARRRAPLPVLLAISAVALAEWVADLPVAANVALFVAIYSVGAHDGSRRNVITAAVVAETGVVLAALRWAPVGTTLTALLLLTGSVVAPLVLGVYVRTRRAYLAELLDRARTAERDRDQRALLAAAEERARIAREMHDIVAHSISIMVALSDGAAATALRDGAQAREASQQASATGRQALAEMHRLLGVLRDDGQVELAPQPGLGELDDLLATVRRAGLPVELVELGSRSPLPASAQLAVYRIVQESLTNVVKHGRQVSHVTVTLRYDGAGVDVLVEDDGVAAPGVEPREPTAGHGLVGMRERAAGFAGALQAGFRPGGGWRVAGHLRVDGAPIARGQAPAAAEAPPAPAPLAVPR